MSIIGIICEYNPFHNGHLYHLNKIKEQFSNSIIILIINGYFSQRGEISLLTKEAKTQIALNYGVDIVLELPVMYGTQSSDTFAYKSIEILNYFKVDKIVFGSESNNLDLLNIIADIQLNNKEYQKKVQELLKTGINYPTALAKALNISENINNPNDLLGISYLKAIKTINHNIQPITIKRTNSYHDLTSNSQIVSASNIRQKINNKQNIFNYLPNISHQKIINPNYQIIFNLLKYQIITNKNLSKILTIDEGIENRLLKYINQVNNINELISKIKTKRYTYNKLNRMLTHILLSISKTDAQLPLAYIKILGFSLKGQEYLNQIKKDIVISLKPILDSKQYHYEITTSIIYDLITNQNTYQYELQNKPIILNDFHSK